MVAEVSVHDVEDDHLAEPVLEVTVGQQGGALAVHVVYARQCGQKML